MAAEIINIFDPILRKVRAELKKGPLPMSYLCTKYGATVFLKLMEMTKDFKIEAEEVTLKETDQ